MAKRGAVTIDEKQCKGCEICVDVCPVDVLVMSEERNAKGYHFPLLMDGCISCQICAEMCPDFVFEVYRFPG
jgi:2-oxoglutarate ferredoxin oxidoreductase subunit delta